MTQSNIQSSQLLGSKQVSDRTAQLQADVQQGQARVNQLPAFDFSHNEPQGSPMFPGGFWNNVKGGAGIVTQGIGNMINGQPFLQTTPMGNIVNPAGPTQQNVPVSQTNPVSQSDTTQSNPAKQSTQPTQMNSTPNQQGTGVNTSGSNASNSGAIVNPDGSVSEPTFGVPTEQTDSGAFKSQSSTFQDVINKQNRYQNIALEALQNQLQTKYQGMGDVLNAKYSGDTTDYGIGAGFLAQQRADIQNLKATIPMQVAEQGVGYAQQNIQNTLAAQSQLGNVQISQNGDVIGTQRDPTTGQVTPINMGNVYAGTYSGQPVSGGSSNQSSQSNQNTQNQNGIYGSQGYENINAITNPNVKTAVVDTPIGGAGSVKFISLDKVPSYLQNIATQQAAEAGIPALDKAGTDAVYAAQQILDIVDASKALAIRNLGSGASGRVSNSLINWANNYLQFNPDLSNFKQLRDAASKATTALAGGNGSGFRMNMGIIEAAIGNMPQGGDSKEWALTQADALATQIINGLKPKFPNVTNGNYGGLLQSQYTGNSNQQVTPGSTWDNL